MPVIRQAFLVASRGATESTADFTDSFLARRSLFNRVNGHLATEESHAYV